MQRIITLDHPGADYNGYLENIWQFGKVVKLLSFQAAGWHMYEPTPKVTAPLPPSSTMQARVSAALLALLMGYFWVFQPISGLWVQHWLVKDGTPGMAIVTKEHWAGHNAVVYQYRVGQRVYTGQGRRSLHNSKYANVMPGEKTIVYFSASHPWLSAIDLPSFVTIPGLPVALLVWVFEAGFIITVINPKSRWAFDFRGQRRTLIAQQSRREGWDMAKDRMLLIGCGVVVVFVMAALGIGINALFGRK